MEKLQQPSKHTQHTTGLASLTNNQANKHLKTHGSEGPPIPNSKKYMYHQHQTTQN